MVHADRVRLLRQGEVWMVNEAHTRQRAMLIRNIIARMRHDGCAYRNSPRS
jgi:hypothetical protein